METTEPDMSEEMRQRLIGSIPLASSVDSYKENIQPRPQGRSVAALAAVFEMNHSERERELQHGHQRFEDELEQLEELDDPLEVYIRYVEWTHVMYPQGPTAESRLLELFQDATHRFKEVKKYKNDTRYLKLWIEYSKLVEDAREVFKFMIKWGIGQTEALFYEAYSAYYERTKKCTEAIEVYRLGIKNEATPLNRLKKNLARLEARIEERKRVGVIKDHQQEAKVQMESLRSTGQRTMLGQKFDAKSRVSVPANVYNGIEANYSAQPSSRSRPFGNERQAQSESSSSSFSVYKEPPTQSTSNSILPRKTQSTTSSNKLHTTTSRSENKRPVEKFLGATIPQADIIQPIVDAFQVYQDDDSPPPSRPATLARSDSLLSIGSTSTESSIARIRKHPTNNETSGPVKRVKRSTPDYKELEKRYCNKKGLFQESEDTHGKPEYIMMLKECIDQDLCVHEYRMKSLGLSVQIEHNSFQNFYSNTTKPRPDEQAMTTETFEAMKSVSELFTEPSAYTKDEEDLTWNNPVQTFHIPKRPPVNENE